MVNLTPYPLSTLPAPYDIVWCRFPFHDSLGNPAPYARPCLVKNVAHSKKFGEVHVVFGTTKLKMIERTQDFFVSKVSEIDNCGLARATRFDLDKIAWIPWTEEWFEVLPGYSSPVIGHLTAHSIKMLQITMSYKQAQKIMEAKLAAQDHDTDSK